MFRRALYAGYELNHRARTFIGDFRRKHRRAMTSVEVVLLIAMGTLLILALFAALKQLLPGVLNAAIHKINEVFGFSIPDVTPW